MARSASPNPTGKRGKWSGWFHQDVVDASKLNEGIIRGKIDGQWMDLKVVSLPLAVGDVTQIVAGPMTGLEAVVQQLLPARERVKVLLEFLGRRVEAEVKTTELVTRWVHPLKAV